MDFSVDVDVKAKIADLFLSTLMLRLNTVDFSVDVDNYWFYSVDFCCTDVLRRGVVCSTFMWEGFGEDKK